MSRTVLASEVISGPPCTAHYCSIPNKTCVSSSELRLGDVIHDCDYPPTNWVVVRVDENGYAGMSPDGGSSSGGSFQYEARFSKAIRDRVAVHALTVDNETFGLIRNGKRRAILNQIQVKQGEWLAFQPQNAEKIRDSNGWPSKPLVVCEVTDVLPVDTGGAMISFKRISSENAWRY